MGPYEALQAENARLRTLVEPKEWLGWEQVDSIYDEARLLRKERDEAREQLRGAVEALRELVEAEEHFHPSDPDAQERLHRTIGRAAEILDRLGGR